MRIRHSIVAAGIAVFALAGCQTAPIMNVDKTAVATASNKSVSAADVRGAIVRAGTGLGWVMKDDGPNKLVGTLNLRSHSATIDIPYSAKDYSLLYRSSTDLNAADGKIHKNYNGWIQNLQRGIASQLSAL